MWLAITISVLSIAVLAVVLVLLFRAHRRLAALDSELVRLSHEIRHADEEFSGVLAEVTGSRIIVEVINPMTLARNRSRVGGALVGVAPRVIRRRVHDIVAREMKAQLADEGVESHLVIFHPTGS